MRNCDFLEYINPKSDPSKFSRADPVTWKAVNAFTCLDPITNIVQLICINGKSSPHISDQFKDCWLLRYPRPNQCVQNNGGEFIGWPFKQLLHRFGVNGVTATVKNPQSNAICKRMHQTVGNILRTVMYTNPPTNQLWKQTKFWIMLLLGLCMQLNAP